jgi:hypothetical protein
MKKKIFTIGLVILGTTLNAQVSDSVALGAGYMNESYYSLQDGEVANVINNDWDLAFDMSNFGATIRSNRLSSVFLYPGSISDWETLDTAGIEEWTRYYNSDITWSFGALNAPATDDPEDLGWGTYNTTTHFTDGSRLFVVELQSGEFRKLFIEKLASGTYTFQHDKLDNSDLSNETVVKADYNTQNFIHYSMETKTIISREPHTGTWDIVFSNYHSEIIPDVYYGVTGVLSNVGVTTQEIDDLPSDEAIFSGTFDNEINVIGHNWKSFNMDTWLYDIEDSLTYFVFTNNEDVWKLVMTGFNGSVDGKVYFTKELVSASGINEEAQVEFALYPNPTVDFLTVSSSVELDLVNIYGMNGQLVQSTLVGGANMVQLDVERLTSGTYIVETRSKNGVTNVQKILIAD